MDITTAITIIVILLYDKFLINKMKPMGAVIINIGIITHPRYFGKFSNPVKTEILEPGFVSCSFNPVSESSLDESNYLSDV